MAKRKKEAKKEKGVAGEKETKGCHIVMCIDEKTGKAIMKKDGVCPDGYYEKVVTALASKGAIVE